MAEMFGLSRPVPSTMSTSPAKKAGFANTDDSAIAKWPSEMSTAP